MMYQMGASDAFDALVYGNKHPSTTSFLQNQVSNLNNTLNDAGRAFMERSKQAFEYFNGNAAIDFARRIVSTIKSSFQTEHVISLLDVEALQKASITMQRWVMANPEIRRVYHEQRIDGYSDTYIDVHGSVYGDDHYDYRRVTDGIMVMTEDDYHFKEYIEPLLEGDRDLTFGEQIDIIHTWDKMNTLLALAKDDFTNPNGGYM